MSEARLDQVIKGAPPSDMNVPVVAAKISQDAPESNDDGDKFSSQSATEPSPTHPSSQPQIYLNLLILEASLRSQFLALRARRRTNTFFLTLLCLWNAYFVWLLFFRPREDGSGIGGSVYWVVETTEKMALMGGLLTAILVWGTGQWERGVRWPRRWVGIANRGLRGFHLKIVIVRGPWWRELISHLSFIFPYSSFFPSQGSNFHFIDQSLKRDAASATSKPSLFSEKPVYREGHRLPGGTTHEDIAPGGDHVKLLLLPKSFAPEFRENWDLYRTEYWERENERRAELRRLVSKQQHQAAKERGGPLWWLGWGAWRKKSAPSGAAVRGGDVEKIQGHRHHHSLLSAQQARERKRRSSLVQGEKGSTHSRSSSRSSSNTAEPEDLSKDRRGGNAAGRRSHRPSNAGKVKKLTPNSSRPTTPTLEGGQTLNKRASVLSTASSGTESDATGGGMNLGGGDGKTSRSGEDGELVKAGPNLRTRQRDLVMTEADGGGD